MGKGARLRRQRSVLAAAADPPSLTDAPAAPQIFDPAPHRNRGVNGIDNSSSSPEWDDRLIATLTELGCPRWLAEQLRTYPPARFEAFKVYCWVQLAAEGDGDCKEKVDYYRWYFDQNRHDWLAQELSATGGLGASDIYVPSWAR